MDFKKEDRSHDKSNVNVNFKNQNGTIRVMTKMQTIRARKELGIDDGSYGNLFKPRGYSRVKHQSRTENIV